MELRKLFQLSLDFDLAARVSPDLSLLLASRISLSSVDGISPIAMELRRLFQLSLDLILAASFGLSLALDGCRFLSSVDGFSPMAIELRKLFQLSLDFDLETRASPSSELRFALDDCRFGS